MLIKKRKLNQFKIVIIIAFYMFSVASAYAQQATISDIKKNLQSDFMEGLYHRTYYSLFDRIDPDGFLQESLTGKGVGWEIDYSRQEKEYNRIVEWLDFLESFHTGELYSEFMRLDDDGTWLVGDGGNGEQSSWWCWAMDRLRKDVGLSSVPERPIN